MSAPVIPAPTRIFVDAIALRRLLSTQVLLLCDIDPPSNVVGLAEVLLVRAGNEDITIEAADPRSDGPRIDWGGLNLRVIATSVLWVADEAVARRLEAELGELAVHVPWSGAAEANDGELRLLQTVAATHQSRHAAMARTALAAHEEAYVLRRDLERAKSAQFELQEISRKSGTLVPWLNQVAGLGRDSITLAPEQVIQQILPYPSKGFAGFDLHFEWASVSADLDIRASLHIADSGEVIASWQRHLSRIGGWLHFRLDRALDERGAAMLIRLQVTGPPPSLPSPRLTLCDVERTPELDVVVDDEAIEGKALAFRTWQGPPGLLMPTEDNPAHALRVDPTIIGITLQLDYHLRNAKALGPIASYEAMHPGSVGMIEGAFQLHLVRGEVSLARIPGGFEETFLEVMSEVRIENSSGPYAEFLIGLALPDTPNERLVAELEGSLFAHSGWHVAGPAGANLVTVERPSALRGVGDLVLATRARNRVATDFGWARFRNVRATWHPRCAYPLKFDLAAGAEPLHHLRRDLMEQRRVRRVGPSTPTVSLACAVHRPSDIPNLLRQLAKLFAPNVEILVAANGPKIGSKDLTRLRNALPEAVVWQDAGQALPAVLNACIDRASGDFIAKIDADDLYGENYLPDMLSELEVSGADLVGKSEFGVVFRDEGRLAIHRGAPHHQFVRQVAGGTLFCSLATARDIRFDESLVAGSDYAFQQAIEAKGGSIWSTDLFNYVHVRRSDQAQHTWSGTYNDYRFWPIYRDYGAENLWMLFA